MKITNNDLETLRTAFQLCRTAGIDAVVVTDGMIRGLTPSTKMAIFTPAEFSFPKDVKIGIGRINELEKRLNIFGDAVEGEAKLNDSNEVSLLTIGAGRSKVQFRCTSEKLIKYPKSNDDEPVALITLTKAELQQVSRAIKTLGAETLTIGVKRSGEVVIECTSPTNESFVAEVAASADFQNDPQGVVHIYEGDRLAVVFDTAARDAEEVSMVIGEFGSITLEIKGNTIVALPEADHEGEDDDE